MIKIFRYLKNIVDILIRKFRHLTGLPELSQRKIRRFIATHSSSRLPERGNDEQLSLIVPCYKHARHLPETLKSIIDQAELPDEIIFINDKSPDTTLDILNDFKNSKSTLFVSIIDNSNNIGQAASINLGVEMANHDLIMILNDDDLLFPDSIKVVKETIKENPELYMLGATSIPFSGSKLPVRNPELPEVKNLTLHKPEDVVSYTRNNDINMTHSSCTFFKSAWQYVGGYYPVQTKRLISFSDRDFQLRINCFFTIGVLYDVPLSLWRSDSSVDKNLNS